MKIGIDIGCLGVKDQRLKLGVYQVAFNLISELARFNSKNQYFLYTFQPLSPECHSMISRNIRNIIARPAVGWRYLALPLALVKTKPDVYFGLSQSLPKVIFCPSVVMVHDLGFEHYPEAYKNLNQIRQNTREAIRKANRIIAPSEFTKKDLQEFYQVPENKIEVVYEGCESIFKPTSLNAIEKIKLKYRLKSPYFLFVGAFKKTKNLPRIIRAFSRLRGIDRRISLALTGSDFWLDREINQELVRNLGYVDNKDLPALYSGAQAFVSPSLFEGFGITQLEAMSCGCPVIGGNFGATPEVIGQAGVLVNPKSEEEIYLAMKSLLENSLLRRKLIKAGLVQAKRFSWTKFSKQILNILESNDL